MMRQWKMLAFFFSFPLSSRQSFTSIDAEKSKLLKGSFVLSDTLMETGGVVLCNFLFYNHIKSQIQKNKWCRIIKKELLLAVLSSVSQVGETFRPGASCAKGTCTQKPVVCPFSTFTFRCTKSSDQILRFRLTH